MPFTPYHFGPSGLIGIVFKRWVNLPAVILVNVIIDIEPLVVILNNIRKYPEHGFFHSFAGATAVAVVFSVFYSFFKKNADSLMGQIGLKQSLSVFSVVLGGLIGAWSHVFMDSFLYRDIMPFFPSAINPMYGKTSPPEMRFFCVAAAVAGIAVYFLIIILRKSRKA